MAELLHFVTRSVIVYIHHRGPSIHPDTQQNRRFLPMLLFLTPHVPRFPILTHRKTRNNRAATTVLLRGIVKSEKNSPFRFLSDAIPPAWPNRLSLAQASLDDLNHRSITISTVIYGEFSGRFPGGASHRRSEPSAHSALPQAGRHVSQWRHHLHQRHEMGCRSRGFR